MNHSVNTKYCPDCGYERPLSEFYLTRPRHGNARYSTRCKRHHSALTAKRFNAQQRRAAALRAVLKRHGLEAR